MQMAAGLDTGDMLLKGACPITEQDTGQTIHDRLAEDGAKALLTVLEQIEQNMLTPESQDESQSSYAQKLSKEEAVIDWNQAAEQIDLQIRAFNPWPVAFTLLDGKPLRIFMSRVTDMESMDAPGTVIEESPEGICIATGKGVLAISRLQLPGKKAMDVRDFLNGQSLLGCKLPS